MNGQSDLNNPTSSTSFNSTSSTGGPVLSGSDTDTTKTANQVKDTAKQVASQAQDKVSQATDQVKQQTKSRLSDQIGQASQVLQGVAHAVTSVGDQLRQNDQTASYATYADKAAEQVNRAAYYLKDKNADQLINSAEDFARRQPVWFLAGAFVVGVFGARFLKSSQSHPLRQNIQQLTGSMGNQGSNYQGMNYQGSSNYQGGNYQGQQSTMSGNRGTYYSTAETSYTDVANNDDARLRNTTR